MSKSGRTILGIIVVLAIGALLSVDVPRVKPDLSNLSEHSFWLQLKSALGYFVAVTGGAIVAGRNFVGPALTLAVLGWMGVVYIVYDIGRVAAPVSIVEIAAQNVFGLFLLAIAAVSGAILGRWFYKHEFENVTSAS